VVSPHSLLLQVAVREDDLLGTGRGSRGGYPVSAMSSGQLGGEENSPSQQHGRDLYYKIIWLLHSVSYDRNQSITLTIFSLTFPLYCWYLPNRCRFGIPSIRVTSSSVLTYQGKMGSTGLICTDINFGRKQINMDIGFCPCTCRNIYTFSSRFWVFFYSCKITRCRRWRSYSPNNTGMHNFVNEKSIPHRTFITCREKVFKYLKPGEVKRIDGIL